ncbi:cyclic pyranopterin monophosphate synthase MoaC [Tsukamurella strandjordii]|uniref:cyclic pyranopterin monophosphate synthase MoaC n=1 Tax=Tsukamurella strandjordii TaxID=147577 RepID=UPI003F723A0C
MDLTHVDHTGAARMVDVTGKDVTARTAVAAGVFRTTAEVIEKIAANAVAKGDVLATARIAGIMGVKRTPDLVPLCHPLPVSGVQVELEPGDAEIAITATVRCTGRTGVEMEALTAVAVAGLTLHDMVKAIDPAAVLTDIRVLTKEGGKTGPWSRDD